MFEKGHRCWRSCTEVMFMPNRPRSSIVVPAKPASVCACVCVINRLLPEAENRQGWVTATLDQARKLSPVQLWTCMDKQLVSADISHSGTGWPLVYKTHPIEQVGFVLVCGRKTGVTKLTENSPRQDILYNTSLQNPPISRVYSWDEWLFTDHLSYYYELLAAQRHIDLGFPPRLNIWQIPTYCNILKKGEKNSRSILHVGTSLKSVRRWWLSPYRGYWLGGIYVSWLG